MTFSELLAEALSRQDAPQKTRKGHLSQAEIDRLSKLLEPTDGA
jgi:hypothetical protein